MLFYGWKEVKMVDWLVLVQMLVLGFGKSSFLGDSISRFRKCPRRDIDASALLIP